MASNFDDEKKEGKEWVEKKGLVVIQLLASDFLLLLLRRYQRFLNFSIVNAVNTVENHLG